MKSVIAFIFLLSISFSCFAQNKLSNFYINYSISIESDQPMASLLTIGSSLEFAFNASMSKSILSFAGGANTVRMTADNKLKKSVVLMDLPDGKKALKMDDSRLEELENTINKIKDNPIRYTDSYKTIAGLSCQKVFMKHLESGASIILYLSDKIHPQEDIVYNMLYRQLKGFPVGIVVRKDNTTVKLMAESIKPVNAGNFSMSIPQDYELTTMEQMRKEAEKKYGADN